MSRLIFVGGGARSGKSRFAQHLAERVAGPRRFVATAEILDHEMRERVERHRRDRGDRFTTVEAPVDLVAALEAGAAVPVVVVDCLTLWLSNMLASQVAAEEIDRRSEQVLVACRRFSTAILVANEVGLGLVPATPLGRLFRDLAGRLHQRVAAAADQVYFGAMGVMLQLKPQLRLVAPRETS